MILLKFPNALVLNQKLKRKYFLLLHLRGLPLTYNSTLCISNVTKENELPYANNATPLGYKCDTKFYCVNDEVLKLVLL